MLFIFQQLKTSQHGNFPIKIAFAMAVNKAKGQTINRLGIYSLPSPVFPYGQLCVAFS
jgi:hypothetical protein